MSIEAAKVHLEKSTEYVKILEELLNIMLEQQKERGRPEAAGTVELLKITKNINKCTQAAVKHLGDKECERFDEMNNKIDTLIERFDSVMEVEPNSSISLEALRIKRIKEGMGNDI